MKYIITEQQYNLLLEEDKEQKVLELPGIEYFGSWDILQKFLEKRGNPPYGIDGDLDLSDSDIKSLGNLIYVSGNVNLKYSNIKSLGNLKYVKGDLFLEGTKIETLGNLEEVGGVLEFNGSKYIKTLGKLKKLAGI